MSQKGYKLFILFIGIYFCIFYLRVETQNAVFTSLSFDVMENTTCEGVIKGSSASRNVATEQDRTNAASLFTFIAKSNPNFGVKLAIDHHNYGPIFKSVLQVSIPWLILFLVSFLGWISCIMSCACDCCCPPSKCCRRDVYDPMSNMQLQLPLICLGIFSLVVIAVSIPGIIYAAGIGDGIKSTRCALFAAVGDLMLPQQGIWPGMIAINDRISILSNGVQSFVNQTNLTFNYNPSNYSNNLSTLRDQNKKLNQQIFFTHNSKGSVVSYESYYSKNKALDYLCCSKQPTDKKFTQSLTVKGVKPQDQIIDLTYKSIIGELQIMKLVSNGILNNTLSFISAIKNGSNDMNGTITNLTRQTNNFYTTSETANGAAKYINYASLVLYGVSLLLATLAIISIFLLLTEKYWARYILNCIWFTYGLIMMIGFIIVAILYPVNGILVESCSYFDGMINVRADLVNQKLIEGKSQEILLECLFDGGDILRPFNLTEQLILINNLSMTLDNFTQVQILQVFDLQVDLILQVFLDNQKFLETFWLNGIVDDKPATDIVSLMGNFDSSSAQTDCSNDIFSVDQVGCGSGRIYENSQPPSKKDLSSPFCLGGVFLSQNADKSLTNRYAKCPSQADNYQILKDFFLDQNTQWLPISNQEKKLLTQNTINLNNVKLKNSQIKLYASNSGNFLRNVTDKEVGLLKGLNCTFLNVTAGRFYDAVCVNLIPSLWKTQLLLAILSVSMLMASFAGCCASMRFAKVAHKRYLDESKGVHIELSDMRDAVQQFKYINPNTQTQNQTNTGGQR